MRCSEEKELVGCRCSDRKRRDNVWQQRPKRHRERERKLISSDDCLSCRPVTLLFLEMLSKLYRPFSPNRKGGWGCVILVWCTAMIWRGLHPVLTARGPSSSCDDVGKYSFLSQALRWQLNGFSHWATDKDKPRLCCWASCSTHTHTCVQKIHTCFVWFLSSYKLL